MSKNHSTVSRRDFLKLAGIGGAGAAAAAGTLGWAYSTGSHAYAHAGWENRQGYEYFDRKPFEVDEVSDYNWKVIGPDLGTDESPGGIHRCDNRHFYTKRFAGSWGFGRPVDPNDKDSLPDVWPSAGVSALDPFWREYYDRYPMELERDKSYKYNWMPGHIKHWQDTNEDRARFNANEGYLALLRANAFGYVQNLYNAVAPTEPPEISDWKNVNKKRAVFNSPEDAANLIKRLAHDHGAVLVRITKLNPAWVCYTHTKGVIMGGGQHRGFGWDIPIVAPPWWEYAIVLSGTMNWDTLYSDPNYGTSSGGYEWSAHASVQLAKILWDLGYPARAHWPAQYYDLVAPPIAADAGLGEIGRTSNCVCPEFGGDFRPAVVTTSLPMALDKPIDFRMADFCRRCMLCAEVCPTQAISYSIEPDYDIRGLRRFYTDHAKCRDGWTLVGGPGGCRACVGICPWTKKNTWTHRFVREVLTRDPTGITQNMAVWAEKNMYPKNMAEDLLPPKFMGVIDPPEWIVTENYISGFTDTPMGVK